MSWGGWDTKDNSPTVGKMVLESSEFSDFKCTISYWNDDGNFGFVNNSTNENYKYHLWFVPSDTIFQNINNESFLKEYIEHTFPTIDQTHNDDKLWIVIDRRMESLNIHSALELTSQIKKLGYNVSRVKFLCNSFYENQNLLVNFPFEFYLRSLRFKLSDDEFGELVERDIAINHEYNDEPKNYKKWLLNLDNVEPRPYTFLSYAGSLPPHKLLLLSELYRRKLDKYCLISALNRDDDDTDTLRERVREFQSNGVQSLDKSKILDMLPIYLDVDRNLSKNETVGFAVTSPNGEGSSEIGDSQPKKYHYNQSYFYLANETSYDCARITSHIKSAILHPMIFNAGAGTLKLFKSWGFKSFPKVFDESYDDIIDDVTRHNFVLSEIERICLLSKKDKHELYLKSIPTIKYNQDIFINFDIKKLTLGMFNQLVS
jgi:hypothetical protein